MNRRAYSIFLVVQERTYRYRLPLLVRKRPATTKTVAQRLRTIVDAHLRWMPQAYYHNSAHSAPSAAAHSAHSAHSVPSASAHSASAHSHPHMIAATHNAGAGAAAAPTTPTAASELVVEEPLTHSPALVHAPEL